MTTAHPAWRSLLYVPANVERFVRKAATTGADAIQLDLEDAIAPAEKAAARACVAAAAASLAAAGRDVVVRINRPLALAVADIAAAVGPHVVALALPKVAGPDHVRLLAEVVAEAEEAAGVPVGRTRFIAMIETADAALAMRAIAAAHPRVCALTLGTEDFATDLGVEPDALVMDAHHAMLVASAVAAGVLPLGLVGSIAAYGDAAAFDALARRSRGFGYRGSSCIHPAQIAALNAAFTPSDDDVAAARAIVAAYDAARASGAGAVGVGGRMIDVPVADRARALLTRYEALITPRAE